MLNQKQPDEIDLREVLFKVLHHWMVFAISLALCIVFAFLINTYKAPEYTVYTKLLIKTDENGSVDPSQFLEGFGLLGESKNFQNEIQVLKSTYLIKDALRTLNHEISYFEHKDFGKRELYKSSPLIIVFDKNHHQPLNLDFKLDFDKHGDFTITAEGEDISIYNYRDDAILFKRHAMKLSAVRAIGDEFEDVDYSFKVLLNNDYSTEDLINRKFSFRFNDINKLAKSYQSGIKIIPTNEEGTVANIMVDVSNVEMGIDFLNALARQYLRKTLDKNNYIALSTIEYIDNQLEQISDSLNIAERKLQDFRMRNQIIDMTAAAGDIFTQKQTLLVEQKDLEVQIKYYEYIKEYLDENKSMSDLIAPSSMGIEDPLLNNMILELTTLNSEKNSLIDNNQEKSPYLKILNVKIENLKNTISENIDYVLNTSQVALDDVNERIGRINYEISQLPQKERELVGIERDFQLTDGIYTFLLEKRAEAQIAKASNLPDCEIIEPAGQFGDGPNTPKKKINYIVAFFLGLLLPLLFMYVKDLLSDVVSDVKDITRWSTLTVLGVVLKNPSKIKNAIIANPKSPISESLRAIRTNYKFYSREGRNQVALVTSTHEKEGKSFLSLNLASAFALDEKKTALVSLDLRKNTLEKYMNIKSNTGITSYLIGEAILDDITVKTDVKNLFFIPAGNIPPNPTELFGSVQMAKLIEELRNEYEYVFIDTPPVGLVTDGFIIMEQVDLCLYVVRQKHTSKRAMQRVLSDLEQKKLANTTVIFNDVNIQRRRDGYRYGYYSSEPKHGLRRFLSRSTER